MWLGYAYTPEIRKAPVDTCQSRCYIPTNSVVDRGSSIAPKNRKDFCPRDVLSKLMLNLCVCFYKMSVFFSSKKVSSHRSTQISKLVDNLRFMKTSHYTKEGRLRIRWVHHAMDDASVCVNKTSHWASLGWAQRIGFWAPWKILVKLDHFPKDQGEKLKIFETTT